MVNVFCCDDYTITNYFHAITDATLDDRTVVPATDQAITCSVSGLSQNTPVTWIGPDDNEISESDTNNYEISQGSFIFTNKAATLTIKAAKMGSLTSGAVFKCKLRSSLYPTHSPDVVKEMELSFFTLGTYNIIL